jgi:tau tubulin kinase
LGTAIGAGIQSLEGIQDLHSIGFLHRDLKPANLAIGRGNKSGIIYLIDFGIARKYVKDNEEMKAPRCQIGFKGTIRYASINCHHGHELGPKDDCESLMYVFFEFIHPKGLPWVRTFLCSHNIHFFPKHMNDRGEVVKLKEECRSKKRDKLIPQIGCREEFSLMLDYIDNRKYADKIDYKYLYDMFKLVS